MADKNFKFSKRLKDLYNQAACWKKIEDFAIDMEIHKNSATNYLEGGRVPEWDILVKIRDKFFEIANINVSIDYLLTGHGPQKSSLEVAENIQEYQTKDNFSQSNKKEIRDFLKKAEYVLKSNHQDITPALKQNIMAFYNAVLRDSPKKNGNIIKKNEKCDICGV